MFKNNSLHAHWISNVKICSNDKNAMETMISLNSNTLFPKILEFKVDGNMNTTYYDFSIITNADIISNFRKVDNLYTRFDIIIDDVVVSDIDFIITAVCYYSKIKCRFYVDENHENNTVFRLSMDCIYLTSTNRKDIRNGPIDTINFHYNNGFCVPRNVKMLYFK